MRIGAGVHAKINRRMTYTKNFNITYKYKRTGYLEQGVACIAFKPCSGANFGWEIPLLLPVITSSK